MSGGPRLLSAELGDHGLKKRAFFSELVSAALRVLSRSMAEEASSPFSSAKHCRIPTLGIEGTQGVLWSIQRMGRNVSGVNRLGKCCCGTGLTDPPPHLP